MVKNFMNTIEKDFIVKKAEKWDLWRGWIRLNEKDRRNDGREVIPRKSICQIEANDKRIYRAVLGNDRSAGTISMDYDTRNALKVELNRGYHFKITRVYWYKNLVKWSRFCWKHPDPNMSIGFRIGFFAIFTTIILSMIAILISVISK